MPAPRPAFFTSEFLAQLERLSLLSRRIFRGRVKGERRSLRRGHSVEFCDYRAYGVGDDLRYVDWNIYGRLDRLHVKLFVDEEDLCLHLIVDASASMNFGSPTKLEAGVRIAAALGFVGLVNHERVGVGVLRNRVAEGWPPTRGRNQVTSLLDFLARVEPGGGTSLNEGLDRKSTRLNSSHSQISYAVFCLTKKKCSNLTTSLRPARPRARRPAVLVTSLPQGSRRTSPSASTTRYSISAHSTPASAGAPKAT